MAKVHELVGIVPIISGDEGALGVLYLRRAEDDDIMPNFWCVPSGHVEEGETKQQAALRELKEETGIEATEGQLIELVLDLESKETMKNGKEFPLKAAVYAVVLPDKRLGDVTLIKDHSAARVLGLGAFDEMGKKPENFANFTRTDRLIAEMFSARISDLCHSLALPIRIEAAAAASRTSVQEVTVSPQTVSPSAEIAPEVPQTLMKSTG